MVAWVVAGSSASPDGTIASRKHQSASQRGNDGNFMRRKMTRARRDRKRWLPGSGLDQLRMRLGDLARGLLLTREGAARVGAIQHETLAFAVGVPDFLEPQGGGAVAVGPKDADHFAERPHRAMGGAHLRDQLAEDVFEQHF